MLKKIFSRPSVGLTIDNETIYCVATQVKNKMLIVTETKTVSVHEIVKSSEQANIALAIPANLLIEKTITIPSPFSKKEIKQFLNFNLEQLIGIPARELYYDYLIENDFSLSTTLHIYAVGKKTMIPYQNILEKNSWQITILEPDFIALDRYNRLFHKVSFLHPEDNTPLFAASCGLLLRAFDE
jgi:Tfp pilus assembly PilM family ATPase